MQLDLYRLNERSRIKLQDYDPNDTAGILNKEQILAEYEQMKDQLQDVQEKLYAGKTNSLLVVFQGMDCSGKDGVVRNVFSGINPQGFRAESFKQPTSEEAAHDFLWRTHKLIPAKGYITSFNRSYYEEVLITRVHGLIDNKEAEKRLKHIQHFEKLLCDSGTVVIKCFLHISKDFQLEKLQQRMENPDKRWKFDPQDFEERKLWTNYMRAYEDAFKATASKSNPWYIVPSNHRWFRDYLVLKIIVSTLSKLNLSFPKVEIEPIALDQ
jgi:PPK2 family polyphosphate:nucleotide phosphotransferase